jgi:hypothetical protein
VRRPGSSGSELHFAGTRKSGSEEVRLAIVVQRSGRDIDRESVIDVRGALHHYGQAQSAWLVTIGRITSGAREEASAQAAACALFDGNALATAMERLGVAMKRHVIPHHEIDYDLLESLGDSPEQRERREREEERERRQYTERSVERRDRDRDEGRTRPSSPPAAARHVEVESIPPSRVLRGPDWDEEDAPDIEPSEIIGTRTTNAVSTVLEAKRSRDDVEPSGAGDDAESGVHDDDSADVDDDAHDDDDDTSDVEALAHTDDADLDDADAESDDDDEDSDEDDDYEAGDDTTDERDVAQDLEDAHGEHTDDADDADDDDSDDSDDSDDDDADDEESDEPEDEADPTGRNSRERS